MGDGLMRSQHYPQMIDAVLTAGTAVGNAIEDWASAGQDTPTVTWPTAGQESLFDGNDYQQAHTELPWIPDSMMSDDDAYQLMVTGDPTAGDEAHLDWGWSS